ncbi:solute carrier family 9 (sodium/hydrogen exchanger) member 6/7 [Microdochium nivale]|nr:solute carrier family 9 (sodium/hydrogen exchanger) member 6/7 [Microdochium nivale]
MNRAVGAYLEFSRRRAEEETEPDGGNSSDKEVLASWALCIQIVLLIVAFFTSYMLQQKKVQAVHETVISIFAGMTVGLIIRITSGVTLRDFVSFDYQIFFNLLLPPIILNSGYELHQANFFRNIGTILTFAFAGTFLSAVVIGTLLWLYTRIPIEGLDLSFVEAISVGATLSATDPVTILAIFNTYKVDPKLYTVIFGESILNDAIAIVMFETAHSYTKGDVNSYGLIDFFKGIGTFLGVFFGSLIIGVIVGVGTALMLKLTYVRRYPQIESCLVVLIAYVSYFFSQGLRMSGIVSLLFCGITLKHYAYFNMSRRTQLSTKYFFQILAQLSENFIFIYLGLSLFTDNDLQFQPLLIIVTVVAVCAARWVAVFPLSRAINWFHHYRARRRGQTVPDELPYAYQAMLFWAGLRGAVGVALAALLTGENSYSLKATVLVVVVLTVIIFGGTTARMLEILGIRTGVVEEVDSDDEFDIETAAPSGPYTKRSGSGIGYTPRGGRNRNGSVRMHDVPNETDSRGYLPGHVSSDQGSQPGSSSRGASKAGPADEERADLLDSAGNGTDSDFGSDIDISDLPPPARRSTRRASPPIGSSMHAARGDHGDEGVFNYPTSGHREAAPVSASAAIRQLFTAEDPQALLRQLDEEFIKPKLLLGSGPQGRSQDDGGAGPG